MARRKGGRRGRARNWKEEGSEVVWEYGGEVGFGYVLCRPLATRVGYGWMDTQTQGRCVRGVV